MSLEPFDLPRVFAGLLMLSLAFWCIAIDVRSRVLRAFALLLVLRGMLNLLLPLGSEGTTSEPDVWTAYTGYYQIAVPFAAAAFAVRLLHDGPRPKTMLTLLLAAIALEAAYAWNHALFWGPGGGTQGVLHAAISIGTLAYLAIAHALLRRPDRARVVAAVSFTLFPIFAATFDTLDLVAALGEGQTHKMTSLGLYYPIRVAALAYAGYLAVLVARLGARWGVVAMAASVVAGVIPRLLQPVFPDTEVLLLAAPLNGLLSIAMPVAVAWALTAQSMFGAHADVRLQARHVVLLFATVWALFIVGLGLAWAGIAEGGTVVGMVAVAVLLFLLVQSWDIGVPGSRSPVRAVTP